MKKTRSNIFRDIYYQPYNDYTRVKLYSSSKASLQMMQRMALLKRLEVHSGCVNSVCWNATGDLILSGSDDQQLVITNAYNYKLVTAYQTPHRANIFSAKFLPNSGDHRILSCSGDGIILYTDLMRFGKLFYNQFKCHVGTTYEIATIPNDPHNFLSCGEDGTVRSFDLRFHHQCMIPRCKRNILISCDKAVTALSVNLAAPYYIAIGCSDSTVRIFDRRMLGTPPIERTESPRMGRSVCTFTVPEFEGNSYRITSLNYSADGQDVLVSYSSDHLYLFNVKDQASVQLKKDIPCSKGDSKKKLRSTLSVRRLRLRGDWSDTGPDARPECEGGRRSGTEIAQARPLLHTSLMQRMTNVLSRMLSDPATRAALCGGGEDSLEGVIDQQDNAQNNNNDSVGESSEERRDNETERALTQSNREAEQQMESPSTSGLQRRPETSSSAAMDMDVASDEAIRTSDQSSSQSYVPMETESSQIRTETCSIQPCSSRTADQTNEIREDDQSSNDDSPCSSMENKQEGHMMENLQDRLTKMRVGFLEKHGSEPAVSLTYTDKSSTSATIALGVADEMTRDAYHAGPSGNSGTFSGINHDIHMRHNDLQEKTDENAFIDSDDEDTRSAERLIGSAETEMDEAMGDSRSRRGSDEFDKTWVSELRVKQKYMGHRNARTMIKEANFWGDDFVMSGSDCGHVFVWEKETAKLCMLLEADQHVVNCVQPHPYLPLLATAGIDYDVKLWAPINEDSSFDEKFAEDLKKRNAIMLEETKDTMTVPAVFMIRMLACLNQIRRASELRHGTERTRSEQEEEPRRDRRITRWLSRFRRYCRL
ncbi:DDB1- and CUL4-associated factor 6-like isoform X2 [Ceratina calcarata]|uniref:DDB1- and CUL4-associated factor 6-like isoform X2 n=1 Tax=Ceratina calcarata TaxID=156304 RepID=A0AAJ7IV85_9HYME|nr:DDB1- and CUL4-associated factor 6-like isoform X2 [Ceratina calcarata]